MRRGVGPLLGLLVGLLAAGVVAVVVAGGARDGGSGCGGDPHRPVDAMIDGVRRLDTDDVLAVLPPGEAAEVRRPLQRLADALEAIGIGPPDWLPPPPADAGAARSTAVSDDLVRVTARYGDVDGDPSVDFVARCQDAQWYVSPWLTILDSYRVEEDQPMRPPSRGAGATSPTEAVTSAIHAAAAGDVSGVVALLDPVSAWAFHRYGSLLVAGLGGVGRELAFHVGNPPLLGLGDGGVRVERVDATQEDHGETVLVTVSSASAHVRATAEDLRYEEGCLHRGGAEVESTRCRLLQDAFGISPELDPALIGMLPWPLVHLYAFSSTDWEVATDAQYITVERDGAWYLQVMATRIHNAAVAVESLDPEQAEALRACVAGGFDAFNGSCDDVVD